MVNNLIITIDGPSGVGKGTLCAKLCQTLGWHYLDSGALYRILALHAQTNGIDLLDDLALCAALKAVSIEFKGGAVLNGVAVESLIRTEKMGNAASKVAQHSSVRADLLDYQRTFATSNGLVADGRDMGTVVFANAAHKFYLTASPQKRAERRYKQLLEKGVDASIRVLCKEIEERDSRDTTRTAAPLKPADDALVIDTSEMDAEQVFEQITGTLGNTV